VNICSSVLRFAAGIFEKSRNSSVAALFQHSRSRRAPTTYAGVDRPSTSVCDVGWNGLALENLSRTPERQVKDVRTLRCTEVQGFCEFLDGCLGGQRLTALLEPDIPVDRNARELSHFFAS
jgi:hypothetical protein